MTSVHTRKKAGNKKRIRPELLPETAKYLTLDDTEYVMIPVSDFGEWYEDAVDSAIAEDSKEESGDLVTGDEVKKILEQRKKQLSPATKWRGGNNSHEIPNCVDNQSAAAVVKAGLGSSRAHNPDCR